VPVAFDFQLIYESAEEDSLTSHFSRVLLTPMQKQPVAGCPARADPAAGKAFPGASSHHGRSGLCAG